MFAAAERDIPAGCQVLHTYGDLSDAQLLQTYGFIDAPPALPGAAAAAKGSKAAKTKSKPAAAETAAGDEAGNLHNYVVLPLALLLDAVSKVAAATHLWPAKKAKKVRQGFRLPVGMCRVYVRHVVFGFCTACLVPDLQCLHCVMPEC
jgi:hypothetical protein